MVRNLRPCSVRGCIPQDPKRFTFPRTLYWAEKWREACANPKLKDIPVERLHTRCAVCRKHFPRHHFANYLMEKILHGIAPTLFLPKEEPVDSMSCIPPDPPKDAIVPPHPAPGQNVTSSVNTQGSSVANYPDTLSDGSMKDGDNESKPAMSPSVLPFSQVLLENKESENPMLGSTPTEMNTPINGYYRYTLCRLCFCFCDSLTSIFEEEHDCGFVISNAIEDLLQFKVSKADDYPQFICSSCLIKLCEFKNFKDELCKQKETFEKALNKLRKSDCEDKDDMVTVEHKHDSPMDECLEDSKEADIVKNFSEFEETPEEDIMAEPSEVNYESEKTCSESEDSVMEEFSEPEESSLDVTEIVLREEFKCLECGEVFKYVNLFSKHVQEHRKTWPLPCQYCDKRFKTLMDLNSHIIMHSDYKPYECEHCGLRTRTKGTLTRHKLTHSDDKPFLCSICGMCFRDRVNLRNHMRTHSNIRSYKCEECGLEFGTSGKLTNHYSTHMAESPHICGQCGKSYRKRKSLIRHITSVHFDEKHFQCEICKKNFTMRKFLNVHMRVHQKHSL